MSIGNKLLAIATAAIIALSAPASFAATSSIDFLITFFDATALTQVNPIYLESVKNTGTPKANIDNITIGTNGTVNYSGVFKGSRKGSPGLIELADGFSGETIEIFCQQSVTAENGNSSITLSSLETSHEVQGGIAYGKGHKCQGIYGQPATYLTFSNEKQKKYKLLFGGKVKGSSAKNFSPGLHSSDFEVSLIYR